MNDKGALVDLGLCRAAEALGDITDPVMELFNRRHPHAHETFDRLACYWKESQLPGGMVELVVYCLMKWADAPQEIRIILADTVPHHVDTLKVSGEEFTGFVDAVIDTITALIPADEVQEFAAWDSLREAMRDFTEAGMKHTMARRKAVPMPGQLASFGCPVRPSGSASGQAISPA